MEEDDPYRYYQPNYPAPRPVEPDDPALDVELRSPGVHRSSRSPEGAEGAEGAEQRLHTGLSN